MSACLFRVSIKAIEDASIEELDREIAYWEATIKDFDWDTFKQTEFESDRALGFRDNIVNAKCEVYDRLRRNNGS